MKIHRVARLIPLLIITMALPITAGAQFIRPSHGSDLRARMEAEARARAAAEAESQARAVAVREEQARQATMVFEIECLQNTTKVLQQSFARHLTTHRRSPSAQEAELSRSLSDLLTDVNHLADDVYGRCSKCARGEFPHVYRTFHMMEYAAEDAQTIAAEAGYARSLYDHFKDIDQHIGALAGTGLRNPRLQRIEMQDHFHHGRSVTKNEQPISMPAVPAYPRPVAVPTSGPQHPNVNPAQNTKTLDLGDLLGRIFGKK